MNRVGLALFLLALCSWMVILVVIFWPGLALWFVLLPLVFVASSRVLASYRTPLLRLALLSLPLVVIALSTLAHHGLRSPDALVSAENSEVRVEFVTEKTMVVGDTFARGSIRSANGQPLSRVSAMVFLDGVTERLPPGVTLEVWGSLTKGAHGDTRAWLVFADQWTVTAPAPKALQLADSLREEFLHRAQSVGGDGGALLPGLALGDTEAVSASLETDMRRAALAHLVAVSGANVALVVGLAVFLAALAGAGVWWRLGIGLATLGLFIVLVTPEPSVVRASVMATIVLLSAAIGRPQAGLVALSLTVWLVLMLDPWQAVDIAFILSVAATAGIVLGYLPAARSMALLVPKSLAYVIALPLVAQLAVQPFVILLRPAIPTYGIVANALAAPLVPLVTVAGLLGSVVGPLLPGFAQLLAWVGWVPATLIASIARAVSELPAPEIPWPPAPWGFVLAGIASAGAFLLLSSVRRTLGAIVLVAAVTVGSVSTHAPAIFTRLTMPAEWTIAQCDVGQGDALLVKTSRGIVAIDTGDDEQALRRCLASAGVRRVAVLLLSHFDRDHVGQTEVFRGMTDTVLHGPPDNSADRERIAQLAQAGAHTLQVGEGDTFDFGDYKLEIVWPTSQDLASPGNDSSVVAVLRPAGNQPVPSLVALGDLGESAQRMVPARLSGEFDVVKVSHHGSADQWAPLYEALGAPVALVGVGEGNDYGHPTVSTVSMLDRTGALTLRSDVHGLVTIHRDADGLVLWSEKDG